MNKRIRYQGPSVTLSAAQCRQLLEVEHLIRDTLAAWQEGESEDELIEGRGALQPLWDLFGAAHRCALATEDDAASVLRALPNPMPGAAVDIPTPHHRAMAQVGAKLRDLIQQEIAEALQSVEGPFSIVERKGARA